MKKVVIKKEMLYSLLIPYIALGIISAVIFIYMYNTSTKNIHEDSITNNYSILNKMSKEIDYLIKDIQRLVVEISSDIKINKLSNMTANNKTNIEHYNIALAISSLKNIKNFNSLIKDVVIYYHKSDFCITSTSLRPLPILYEDFVPSKDIEYELWSKAITDTYDSEQIINLGGQLLYIVTFPYNELVDKLNIIIKIESSQFEELINSYSNLNEGTLYILDSHSNILSSNKNSALTDINLDQILDSTKDIDNQTYDNYRKVYLNGKNYIILYNKISDLNLQSIWLIQDTKLFQKSSYILISFVSMGLAFAIILSVGIYIVKKNYNKIDTIVKRLSESEFKVTTDKKTSEMIYINNAINNIEKRIEYQKDMMVESILRKSLYGLIELDDESYKYLLKTNKYLCEEESLIAVFEPIKPIKEEPKDLKLNMFVIENIIKEIFNYEIPFSVLTIQTWQVIIITPKVNDYENSLDYILDSLERTRKVLSTQLDLNYTVGVSSPSSNITQFKIAYKEAVEALGEKTVIGNNQTIYYGNLEQHHNQYQYNETIHKQLTNYIKLGDIDKANNLIGELFEVNFRQNQISKECGKLFVLDLLETISQITKEMNCKISLEPTDILKEAYTIEDIQIKVYEDIQTLCQHNNKAKEAIGGGGVKKVERIVIYIHDNYKDINLNVSMIADCFDLNASYLSRLFKEQTGENLLTYINSYRVTKAKEQLETTDKTLAMIANDTGFINSVALSRAFKKYEGITPGQYKSIHIEKL